jgi:hydrogenase expression/formation protein HypD
LKPFGNQSVPIQERVIMSEKTRTQIKTATLALKQLAERPLRFMEVCGTHTVSIYRAGLRALFPENVALVSGPGCPVCVTAQSEIDTLVRLSGREKVAIATYGDMVRVPGSASSLAQARALGASVHVVLSAAAALALARRFPDTTVVFAGVGFETTAPATAAVVLEADRTRQDNFLVLNLHKTVPVVLETLAGDPGLALDGFLLPGHVSAIIGLSPYADLAAEHGLACVVAGFEPEQIMAGLALLALQVRSHRFSVQSVYPQAVRPWGNTKAITLLETVFEPEDAYWRGLGLLRGSGLKFRPAFSRFDARIRLGLVDVPAPEPAGCRCGEVLTGRIHPAECPLFGCPCTPEEPVGPCMVSSEGSCAAVYRYGRSEFR